MNYRRAWRAWWTLRYGIASAIRDARYELRGQTQGPSVAKHRHNTVTTFEQAMRRRGLNKN